MADKRKLNLKVVTPDKTLLEQPVNKVSLPTVKGQITILPSHINLITKLAEGELAYLVDDKSGWEYLLIFGGVLSVYNDQVTVIADSAVKAQEIDVLKAQRAKEEAEKLLASKLDKVKFAQAEAGLRRALLELELAKKYKKLHRLPHNR